ncbi:MAG: hypothetical protein WD205_07660 [Rhodothermales bacterium]
MKPIEVAAVAVRSLIEIPITVVVLGYNRLFAVLNDLDVVGAAIHRGQLGVTPGKQQNKKGGRDERRERRRARCSCYH